MSEPWRVTGFAFNEGQQQATGSTYKPDQSQNSLYVTISSDESDPSRRSASFNFKGLTFEQARAKVEDLMRFLSGNIRP